MRATRLTFLVAFLISSTAARAGLDQSSTVFIILMENHNWSSIKGSASAPYINNTLLPMASYCDQYYNPPGLHPSEPNYLWLVSHRTRQAIDALLICFPGNAGVF